MKIVSYFSAILCFLCFLSCNNNNNNPFDDFSYTLIPVQSDGKWGYVNRDGKMVISPQFKNAGLFSDGLALVESEGRKYGYIDNNGKFVIYPEYAEATYFSDGFAVVTPENGVPTCINKKGEKIFTLSNSEYASAYSNGFAVVKGNDKFGYYDAKGNNVVPSRFDDARPFSEGLGGIAINKNGELLWGFVDSKGTIAIEPQFNYVSYFSEGLAGVTINSGKSGYIDKNGKIVINPEYDDARIFSEGLAVVLKDSRYGYIDKNGKIVINLQFDDAGEFVNGIAPVKSGDKWGYVNKTGQYVINPQFQMASKFYDGIAVVESGDKVGLINKDGKYIANPMYSNTFNTYLETDNYFSRKHGSVYTNQLDKAAIVKIIRAGSDENHFMGLSNTASFSDVLQKFGQPRVHVDDYNSAVCITDTSLALAVRLDSINTNFSSTIFDGQNYSNAYLSNSIYDFIVFARHRSVDFENIVKQELLQTCNGSEKPNPFDPVDDKLFAIDNEQSMKKYYVATIYSRNFDFLLIATPESPRVNLAVYYK